MLKFLKDKWPLLLAWNVAIGLIFYAYGCEPETQSMLDPGKKVSRMELESEIEFLLARSRIRVADLDRQQELRNLILQQTLIVAESGGVNPVGIITAILAIMGIGAGADDIRLRRERSKTPYYVPEPKS